MATPDLSNRPLRNTARDRALFVNRDATLRLLRETLKYGSNALLVAPTGSGKSSLLRYVAYLLAEEDEKRVVHLDGRVATSTVELLAILRDRLGAWPRVRVSQAVGAVAEGLRTFANDPQLVLTSPRTETQTLLAEIAQLRADLPDDETIVVLDEAPSPEVARTLFGRLRDELWELPLTWCVAADERDRGNYTEPPADAFWRRIVDLPPLTPEESEELLRRRIPNELPRSVLREIVMEGEGNPRRLLTMAYEVVVEGRTTHDLIRQRRERDERLKRLSPPAQRLLAELDANGPASPSDKGLLQKLGWSRSRASQVFNELEEHGLVRGTTRTGTGTRPRRVFEAIG
jgi:energy-coupling factor transporter ATP-binding protein EcfA2